MSSVVFLTFGDTFMYCTVLWWLSQEPGKWTHVFLQSAAPVGAPVMAAACFLSELSAWDSVCGES